MMYPHAQIFSYNLAATRAPLRCVLRRHGHHLRASLFRFALQQLPEHPQSSVVSAQGDMMIVYHKAKVQVLNRDQSVGGGKLASCFVPEVHPLVLDMFVLFGDLKSSLMFTTGTLLAASHPALLAAQVSERFTQPAGVLDQRPVREGQQAVQPHIDTDLGCFTLDNLRVWKLDLEADVPPPDGALDNDVLNLGVIRDRAVVLDLDLPDVLDIEQGPPLIIESQLAPVAVGKLETIEATASFEAWIAGRFSSHDSAKEGAKGLVQLAKCVLHAGEVQESQSVRVVATHLSKVLGLLHVRHTHTGFFVDITALLKRRVVHITREVEKVGQLLDLPSVGIQAVLVGADHALTPLLFLDVLLDRFCGHMTRSTHIVAACPQRRQTAVEFGELPAQFVRGVALDTIHDLVGRQRRGKRGEQMYVVGLYRQIQDLAVITPNDPGDQFRQAHAYIAFQNRAAKFGTPYEMIVDLVHSVASSFTFHKHTIPHFLRLNNGKAAFPSLLKRGVPCRKNIWKRKPKMIFSLSK